jgi:hypothetical protein
VFEDEDETEEEEEEGLQIPDEEGTPRLSPNLTPTSETMGSFSQRRGTRGRVASGSLFRALPHHRLSVSHGGRRMSSSSGVLPAIFANTGLRTPPLAGYDGEEEVERDPFFSSPAAERRQQVIGGLSVISERPGQSALETSPLVSPAVEMVPEKKESTWKSIPLLMISQVSGSLFVLAGHTDAPQYGLLALHNTTHDQVFLSFLVTWV